MRLDKRRVSGILVHPTSFPSPYGIGDLGQSAYDFIDFLAACGQCLWQVLPLGPTSFGDSPYQSFSAFAGQPLLISPELLKKDGLLSAQDLTEIPKWESNNVDYGWVLVYKKSLFEKAYTQFSYMAGTPLYREYQSFCEKHRFWLDDYALFMALKDLHEGRCWLEWEPEYVMLEPQLRCELEGRLWKELSYYRFLQFLFYRQWNALKEYANHRGIAIIGDIPIFVAADSADVWANKSLFQLDTTGHPLRVAGVPPDYFSVTGQLWGNPLYDWEAHKRQHYRWWIQRIRHQLGLTDYLRIDHFRGFEAYWSVPAEEETAVNGMWVKGPGADLFEAIQRELGSELPILAEDLGVITPEVEALRDDFGFPGMKILQFGFEGMGESSFQPHNYTTTNCLCYTGTHDNDTTLGWYNYIQKEPREKLKRYLNSDGSQISLDMIRLCLGSIARYALFPIQDLLQLDTEARMNTPGVPSGNWTFRYQEGDLTPELSAWLLETTRLYGR